MAGRPSEQMYVETPLLEQLKKLGWTVVQLDDSEKHDPQKSFRESFSEVVIVSRLKAALKRLKVVLIVDRKDLQTQMFKTTKTVKYAINIAESINGLKKLIANTASDVTVAMVHKFGEQNKDKGKDRSSKLQGSSGLAKSE